MTNLPNLSVTPATLDQIGQLSNCDLLDLHGLARDFQALALQGNNVNHIIYGTELKVACVQQMKQRNNGNAVNVNTKGA